MTPSIKGLLAKSFDEQMQSFIDYKFYYPSRVRYLDSILRHIATLETGKRYFILALNSSVAAQRMLGQGGYDFRHYLRSFRERAILGDFVVRVYCLSKNVRTSLGQQLLDLREVVRDNSLQSCLNLYRHESEGFNCAYFVPIDPSCDLNNLNSIFQSALGGDSSKSVEFLRAITHFAQLDSGTYFHEHHDYDIKNTIGCGYQYSPQSTIGEQRDLVTTYQHIAADSSMLEITDPTLHSVESKVAILVALPVEFDSLKNQLDDGSITLLDDSSGVSFFFATTTQGSRSIGLVVAQLPTTGNISSSFATAILIERYSVRDIFLVGIAGGLRGSVKLGDVIVANSVVYGEKKKIYSNQEKPDYKVWESRFPELSTIHHPTRYKSRITTPIPDPTSPPTEAHFGCATLCVEKVISDPSWLMSVQDHVQRKLVAVENEAAGMYFAANAINPSKTRYIAVKAISDFADAEKEDGWHGYAADAAAAYVIDAIHLLRRR